MQNMKNLKLKILIMSMIKNGANNYELRIYKKTAF